MRCACAQARTADPGRSGPASIEPGGTAAVFNFYRDAAAAARELALWVARVPRGDVVALLAPDTAGAASAPPLRWDGVAAVFEELGARGDDALLEKALSYRVPFAFLGVKGATPGHAQFVAGRPLSRVRAETYKSAGRAFVAAEAERGADALVEFEDEGAFFVGRICGVREAPGGDGGVPGGDERLRFLVRFTDGEVCAPRATGSRRRACGALPASVP